MSKFLSKFSQLNLPFYGVRCPTIEIDQKDRKKYSIKENATNLEVLQSLCNQEFKKYLPDWKAANYDIEAYKARVKIEVETLDKLGFIDYILIIWDVFNFCNKEGIATGLGRGCFLPDSMVTKGGGLEEKIQYIKIGDKVISHDKSVQTVLDVLKYEINEDIIELSLENGKVIRCTQDHEIFTKRGWVKAVDLTEDDDIIEVI